jgi:FHA domain
MSNALICPKGHYSTDPDYCSECGISMADTSAVAPAPSSSYAPNPSVVDTCPECGTPNDEQGRFCAVCRYDYQLKQAYTPEPESDGEELQASAAMISDVKSLVSDLDLVAVPTPPVAPILATSSESHAPLELFVEADLSLATASGLVPPSLAARVFHLDLDENVVGRQADSKMGCPELVIADPGISRRHLKFYREPSGLFFALDLDSANGTTINGAPLSPGVPFQISVNDVFVLGGWTRLTVRARA